MRAPPHSFELERALLGALLFAGQHVEAVAQIATAEDFAEPQARLVFEAMVALASTGIKPDFLSVKNTLANGPANGITAEYLAGLGSSMVTVANVGHYAREVASLARRRDMIAFLGVQMENAFALPADMTTEALIEETISGLADINLDAGSTPLVGMHDGVDRVLDAHGRVDRGEISGISTGLTSLDNRIGLMQAHDLLIVGGRPGQGKSALAAKIAYEAARIFRDSAPAGTKPKRVAFFSLEMSIDQMVARIITAQTGIPGPRQRRRTLQAHEWEDLIRVQRETRDLPLVIDDKAATTVSEMLSKCRGLRRHGGVGLVVVDYLQIMGVERAKRSENRTQEVSYIARALKGLAKSLGCPVIALSQISRGVEQRENKRPQMSDLRESGEIEAAADTILMLYREQYYLERDKPKDSDGIMKWHGRLDAAAGKAEVIVAKARHGETGTVMLNFDGPRTWFSDPDGDAVQPELGLGG